MIPLSFAEPFLLAGLLSLPVLWWLLRVMPPRPRRIAAGDDAGHCAVPGAVLARPRERTRTSVVVDRLSRQSRRRDLQPGADEGGDHGEFA